MHTNADNETINYSCVACSALRRGLAQQLTPEQLTVLLQGTAGLYQDLRADIKKRMKTFEEYSLSEILKLPPGLLANPADVQGVAGEVPHVDDEEEATVNKELFELQQDIVEMKQRARDTKTAIKTLDALIDDVKKHAGELESVPHVVGSTHVLMDDVQFVTEKGLAVERTCQKIEETLDKKDAEMKDETMLEAVSQVPKNEKELDKELYAHHSSVKEASAEDLRACRESLFTK